MLEKVDKTYSEIKGRFLAEASLMKIFNIMKDDDEYFLNIFKSFEVEDTLLSNGMNLLNLTVLDPWWENMAYTNYGDPELWWLICLTNNVLNPFEEVEIGMNILAVKKQYLPYVHRDMERIYNL